MKTFQFVDLGGPNLSGPGADASPAPWGRIVSLEVDLLYLLRRAQYS